MPSWFHRRRRKKSESRDQNKPEKATSEQSSIQADLRPPSLPDDKIDSKKHGQSSQTALETTPTVSRPPPPDLWQEALEKARQSTDWKENQDQYDKAVQECQKINQRLLKKTGKKADGGLADAIATQLNSLRDENQEKQWAYKKTGGDIIYFRDVVSRIAQWVKAFKDPGNLVAGLDPTKAASLVWGFIQFFVEKSITHSETRDLALDQEPIANLISRYALVEKFHLNSRSKPPTEIYKIVKTDIIELYSTIILYQLAVYKFLQEDKITHGIQSLVPHKLKELSDKIQKKSAQVDSALNLNNTDLLQNISKSIQLKEPIAKVGCQLQQVLDIVTTLEERKYSDVLEWVSPIRYLDHHNIYKPTEGTGIWLLEHPKCLDWRQSKSSGLFWLRGKMGAGKTNLVSILISHLLDSSPNAQERVAFFYIDNANRPGEAKSAEPILNALLKQLAIQGDNGLMQPVVAKYDQLRNSSSLHQEDCIALITSIVKEYRQTNIIIDAIDELEDDDVRADLLESLKRVVDRSGSAVVKIFISSRDHINIVTIMNEVWGIRREIKVGESNHEDIKRFITGRIQKFDKTLSKPIPDKIREDMESFLKKRANGMFLWVHLSLEYLRKSKAKNPDTFVEKLQLAPPDIQGLYSNILITITKNMESENSDTIQRALSFLMYGQGEKILESQVFLSAINYNSGGKDSELSAKDVLDLCSTFVELDPMTWNFRLIHFSVKEFLQTQPEYNPEAAHGRLAAQCLTSLRRQVYTKTYSRRFTHRAGRYNFDEYASVYWVLHCEGAGTSRRNPPLANILQIFWQGTEDGRESIFDRWVDYPPTSRYSHLVVWGGYDSLKVESKPTPFFLACQYDLREVIESLLGQGWDINEPIGSGSGLSFACRNGHLELATYLIGRGAKVAINESNEKSYLHEHKMIHSSLIATMKSGDPKILELLLRQEGAKPMQAALEAALRERNDQTWIRKSSTSRSVALLDRQIDIMLDHFPDFEYSASVQEQMFQSEPKLTEKLLARNRSLCVTGETFEHLFYWVKSAMDAKDIIQSLLPLNHDFVASKSFISLMKHAGDMDEEDTQELFEYTLELNGSDPAILISEKVLRTAMDNTFSCIPLTKALLEKNSCLKISDDLIRWTVCEGYFGHFSTIVDLLLLLLRHDPIPRHFSQPELKAMLGRSSQRSQILAVLVSFIPDIEIDQELFTIAVHDEYSKREDLEFLLARAPNVVLSTELFECIKSAAPDWAVSQIVASTPPAKITDDVLKAAFEKTTGGKSTYLTLEELIKKAPSDLILSEKTYHAACESSSWAWKEVLQRWPSKNAIIAGMYGADRFQTLIELMPQIEISSASILSICQMKKSKNPAETVKTILSFQPGIVITEDMLFAAAEFIDYPSDRVELLQTLLQHEPHAHLTERVVDRVMISQMYAMQGLKVILNTRPQLELNPLSISMCKYNKIFDFGEYKKTLDEALKRSKSFRLGEREMFDMMAKCTPDALGVVLSERPDAVVTGRVIEQLVRNRDDNWECGCGNEAFDMLLNRVCMSNTQRQALKLEFPDLRVQESSDERVQVNRPV